MVCWRVAWAREWRAIRIRSQPGSTAGISGRRLSRSKRFARFLCTALPTDRPAATPKRELSSSFCRKINTTSGWAYDLPKRRTRLKSDELDRRNLRSTYSPSGRPHNYPFQLVFLTWLFLVTVSRERPFNRRLFNTLRPSAVFMRVRKPCTRKRRRILGWYVRFGMILPSGFLPAFREVKESRLKLPGRRADWR